VAIGPDRNDKPAGGHKPEVFVETDASGIGHILLGGFEGLFEPLSAEAENQVVPPRRALLQERYESLRGCVVLKFGVTVSAVPTPATQTQCKLNRGPKMTPKSEGQKRTRVDLT
jgi:hypothetical protein